MFQVDRRFGGWAVGAAGAGDLPAVRGDRRSGRIPTSERDGRVFADYPTTAAASTDTRDDGEWFDVPSSPLSDDAAGSRFGLRQPERGGLDRLSGSLLRTIAESLMAIACVVTLA